MPSAADVGGIPPPLSPPGRSHWAAAAAAAAAAATTTGAASAFSAVARAVPAAEGQPRRRHRRRHLHSRPRPQQSRRRGHLAHSRRRPPPPPPPAGRHARRCAGRGGCGSDGGGAATVTRIETALAPACPLPGRPLQGRRDLRRLQQRALRRSGAHQTIQNRCRAWEARERRGIGIGIGHHRDAHPHHPPPLVYYPHRYGAAGTGGYGSPPHWGWPPQSWRRGRRTTPRGEPSLHRGLAQRWQGGRGVQGRGKHPPSLPPLSHTRRRRRRGRGQAGHCGPLYVSKTRKQWARQRLYGWGQARDCGCDSGRDGVDCGRGGKHRDSRRCPCPSLLASPPPHHGWGCGYDFGHRRAAPS